MDIEIFNVDAWYAIWNIPTLPYACPQGMGGKHWYVRLTKRPWRRCFRRQVTIWCCYCGARSKV
jgi:hypothetical protein